MHEKTVNRAYLLELVGSIAIYSVMLFASIKFGRPMAEGLLRTVVLLLPMIGFFLAIWAMARHLNRVDEYVRKFTLDSIALAAGVTAGLTFTYGFMETAGYEKLSMFTVWLVLCGSFGIINIARAFKNR